MKIGTRVEIIGCPEGVTSGFWIDAVGRHGTVVESGAIYVTVRLDGHDRLLGEEAVSKGLPYRHHELRVVRPEGGFKDRSERVLMTYDFIPSRNRHGKFYAIAKMNEDGVTWNIHMASDWVARRDIPDSVNPVADMVGLFETWLDEVSK